MGLNIFLTDQIGIILGKDQLRANIIDVTAFQQLGNIVLFLDDRHKHHIRSQLFNDRPILFLGRCFQQNLIFHAVTADCLDGSLHILPAVVKIDQTAVLEGFQESIQCQNAVIGGVQIHIDITQSADLFQRHLLQMDIHTQMLFFLTGMECQQIAAAAAGNIRFQNIGTLPQGCLKSRQCIAGNITTGHTSVGCNQNALFFSGQSQCIGFIHKYFLPVMDQAGCHTIKSNFL